MKRIIFVIVFCIILVGCNKKDDNNLKKEFVDLGKLGVNVTKYNVDCFNIKDVKDVDIIDMMFITNDGHLYQINLNQLYSNNTNCKLVENEKIFTKFIRGGIIDTDNNIYYLSENGLKQFNFENGYIRMPYIKNIDKDVYQNLISVETNSDNINYYYLDNNKLYSYDKNEVIFSKDNENIINVFDNTIITDKSIYIYKSFTTNKEECEKYADVECITKDGFIEFNDKKVLSQLENIKFIKYGYDNVFIVDTNNNIYYGWI